MTFCKNYNTDEAYRETIIEKMLENHSKDVLIPEIIDFAIYLTGHDKETIEQMYNDYVKYKKA